jgi:hypothetical protein
MKKTNQFIALFVSLMLFSCELAEEEIQSSKEKSMQNELASASTFANAGLASVSGRLSYLDTIVYLQNLPSNYTIVPISKPAAPGYFGASTDDLVLNTITGEVNLTQSESGLRHKIYYLDNVTGQRLDSTTLLVSGIDYEDGIYELQPNSNVAYDVVLPPIYNSNPALLLPCSDDDDDDDDQYCVFDETDLNNDGNDDIAGVIQDKLLIDIKNGRIDLKASFHAGVFGSSNPANGLTKDFTLYYRLDDASNLALNKIKVRLIHFQRRSDVPQQLINELKKKANSNAKMKSPHGRATLEAERRRPPLIILVSNYE